MSMPPTRNGFVDVLALVSLALGAFGVVSGLLSLVAAPAFDIDAILDHFGQFRIMLPDDVHWMLAHANLICVFSLLASTLTVWVSWALWKRRESGRIGFIALLVIGAATCIGGSAWFLDLFDAMLRTNVVDTGDDAMIAGTLRLMHAAAWIGTGAIVLLHAGIAWKLCTRAIRAEFAQRVDRNQGRGGGHA